MRKSVADGGRTLACGWRRKAAAEYAQSAIASWSRTGRAKIRLSRESRPTPGRKNVLALLWAREQWGEVPSRSVGEASLSLPFRLQISAEILNNICIIRPLLIPKHFKTPIVSSSLLLLKRKSRPRCIPESALGGNKFPKRELGLAAEIAAFQALPSSRAHLGSLFTNNIKSPLGAPSGH